VNTQPIAGYSVRLADLAADKKLILKLLRNATGTLGGVERKYQWFYESPLLGPTLTLLLCHHSADMVVGMVTIGQRRLQLANSHIDAGLLVDLHVESTHRSLFPALQLLREAISVGLKRYPVLYGFPNISAQPLLRMAGFSVVAQSTRYVRVLRVSRYLPRQFPQVARSVAGAIADTFQRLRYELNGDAGRRIAVSRPTECRADAITYQDSAGAYAQADGVVVSGAHTPEFLQWRFGAAAVQPSDFMTAGVPYSRDGDCYYVCYGNDQVLHVRDTSAVTLSPAEGLRHWRALFAAARQRGFQSVSFSYTADSRRSAQFAEAGFRAREARPVVAMQRTNEVAALHSATWLMTDADEDE
jgi:hypothetical protein